MAEVQIDAAAIPVVLRAPGKGVGKSHRVWRAKTKRERSSAKYANKAVNRSWEEKERLRLARKALIERQREQREAAIEENRLRKERAEERRKRKEENEAKNNVVQVIKSAAKLKRLSRKQMRMIRQTS